MAISNQLVKDTKALRSLNLLFADWERAGGAQKDDVENAIDARFKFRRGNGTVTDRKGFAAGLRDPGNQTRELVANIVRIEVLNDQAIVEVYVYLDGKRRGKAVKGWFRNLRLWEKQKDGRWRCVFWFNKPLPNA
jgi:ketosteroid isomerase-like protein